MVQVYEDAGISGAKGRDKRPAFDRMLKDATARNIDMIAAWSVDRLGRSLQDLVGFLTELQALGCHLYLHQQALDTSTPSGRAMFQMCGVFAEFERAMIVERVNAGLARAPGGGQGARPQAEAVRVPASGSAEEARRGRNPGRDRQVLRRRRQHDLKAELGDLRAEGISMAPKQTETEIQVVAALQGIGQVLQQIAAEVAALRVLLEERLESVWPQSNREHQG